MERIQKSIEKAVIDSLFDKEHGYTKNRYRTSELCYCLRKAYFLRKYALKIKPNAFMASGLLMHEKFPEMIKKLPEFKKAKYEVVCDTKHNGYEISGRADIVTPRCVYELKYSKIREGDGCSPAHKMQANAYACALGKRNYRVIVIDNTSLKTIVFNEPVNTSEYKYFIHRGEILHNALNGGLIPDGPEYNFECYYCDVKDKCKEYLNEQTASKIV